jgi:hypothetical protein
VALTLAQRGIIERARALGAGGQAVALTDAQCAFLVGVIAVDLGVRDRFPEVPVDLPPFFTGQPLGALAFDAPFVSLFERLVALDANSDTYFACLAALHKARLKYERILATQPVPTIDQVGPRGLLQYGGMSPRALTGFLLWRKWLFDIDNRAGQETGYLFEPIIAAAIGGVPASAKKSPVRRRADRAKGRQVDCIREKHAYEIKLRVTIAASGQGRWGEELDFPADCRESGFVPVLVVLDPTQNDKLEALARAFRDQGGDVYIGADAWSHLEGAAGRTMAGFLEKYVREPIQALLAEVPATLPDITLRMNADEFSFTVFGETYTSKRSRTPEPETDAGGGDPIPEDADEQVP